MPSRGSYQVAPGVDPAPPAPKPSARQHFVDPEKCHPPSRPDTSFRDCVLSLALVLLIIAILVLVVRPWSDSHDPAYHGAAGAYGRHNQSKSSTTVRSTTTTPATTVTRTISTTSTESDYSDYDDNGDGDHGSQSSSTTTPTSTTSKIERNADRVTNVDYDDEPVSKPVATYTTTETSPEYPDGESESSAESTTRSKATPDLFPTVHRAETATPSETESPSPSEEDQYMRHPLTTPIADYEDETKVPTTTQIAEELELDTNPQQEEGDHVDVSTESVTEVETDSTTDFDFGLAVANYQPTTSQGGEGATTEEASESVDATTLTTRRHERLARLLVAGTTLAVETTTNADQESNQETRTTAVEMYSVTNAVQESTDMSHQRTTLEEVDTKPRECSTPACRKQAARMLGLMDHSTEPCQDFYQYACGGLRDNELLAEEDAEAEAMARIEGELAKVDNSTSSAALRTFRRFYDLCVEDVGDKDKRIDKFSSSAREAVESIGKLHTRASWTSETLDLTDLLTKLMLRHSTPLIDVTLDVSSNAAGKFALKLTPPVTPSLLRPGPARPACANVAPEESDLNAVYRSYLNCTSDHSRYMQEVEAAVKALRLFPQVNITHQEQLVVEIRQTIEWDVWDTGLLDELPAEGEKRRKLLAKDYQLTTVRGLQDKYKMVNWRKLLSGLLSVDSTKLPDSAEVQVYFQPYLDKLFSNLMTKDLRSLHNALLAMYARDLYAHALIGGARCQRKDRCLRVAVSLMEDVASLLYLSSFNSADLDAMEQESTAAFLRLRETLELQFKDAKWLDEGSRSDVVAKLHQMRIDTTGGRELFTDIALVDARVAGINLDASNDLIKLSAALTARYRQLMYSLYDKNPNSTEAGWTHFLLPFSTTAVSVYGLNSVMVPFGLLTWPLYDPAVPRHVTLARLGFVIAHEMAHHFDSVGINYRAGRGRGDSVLMGTASSLFNEYLVMKCPVRIRYDYEASHTEPDKSTYKFNLEGAELSLNERLADETASALSLDTGVRWQRETEPDLSMPYLGLTTAQEHFLAVAQMFCSKAGVSSWRVALFEREHPPQPLRVNDMLKNSAAFSNAFKCPAGHFMSPTARCDVFPALPADELEYDGGPQSN